LFLRGWELRHYADEFTRLDLMLGMGYALVGIHQHAESEIWFRQVIELAEQTQQPAKKAGALNGLSRAMLHTATKADLYELLDEAVSLAQTANDKHRLSDVLVTKGYIEAFHRDFEVAAATFQQAGVLLRQINHQGWLSTILNNVGKLKQLVGDYTEARRNLEEARTLALNVQFFNTAVLSTSNLGILCYFTEQYIAAIDYYSESIKLMKAHDDIAGLSHVWVLKLFAEADMDNQTAAQDSLSQSISDRHDPTSVFSNIYIVMGGIRLMMDDNPAQTAAWLGLLYHLGGDDPFIREWLDPLQERFHDTFDVKLLDVLMKKGHALELNAIVREVEEYTAL
jgi:tetratricopeptide (TPR) repeat protein